MLSICAAITLRSIWTLTAVLHPLSISTSRLGGSPSIALASWGNILKLMFLKPRLRKSETPHQRKLTRRRTITDYGRTTPRVLKFVVHTTRPGARKAPVRVVKHTNVTSVSKTVTQPLSAACQKPPKLLFIKMATQRPKAKVARSGE